MRPDTTNSPFCWLSKEQSIRIWLSSVQLGEISNEEDNDYDVPYQINGFIPGVGDCEFVAGILQFEVWVSDFWLRANGLKWIVKIFLVWTDFLVIFPLPERGQHKKPITLHSNLLSTKLTCTCIWCNRNEDETMETSILGDQRHQSQALIFLYSWWPGRKPVLGKLPAECYKLTKSLYPIG